MRIGIVGLPFSGKSTLFQTITCTHLDEAVLQRKQANVAVVKVPDSRVDRLAEVFRPKRSVLTAIEFVDVIGLSRGDAATTQFNTAFLQNVRNTDALIHVVRVFEEQTCPHPEGSIDPARDLRLLEAEFILSDMAVIENRLERLRKQMQRQTTEAAKVELAALERCYAALEQERPLRQVELEGEEERLMRGYQFLSAKPLLAALNLPEEQMGAHAEMLDQLKDQFQQDGITFDAFSGKVELELAQLSEEDAVAFMAEYGLNQSALARIISAAYRMLGLISFLTCGEDECRAWTVRRGATAQEAAGVIHTDLQTRFIRAETVSFADFAAHGSIAACKEQGAWRLQGKDYIVQDGDILSIRNG
jgi:ribosome-binding ATPase